MEREGKVAKTKGCNDCFLPVDSLSVKNLDRHPRSISPGVDYRGRERAAKVAKVNSHSSSSQTHTQQRGQRAMDWRIFQSSARLLLGRQNRLGSTGEQHGRRLRKQQQPVVLLPAHKRRSCLRGKIGQILRDPIFLPPFLDCALILARVLAAKRFIINSCCCCFITSRSVPGNNFAEEVWAVGRGRKGKHPHDESRNTPFFLPPSSRRRPKVRRCWGEKS